MIIRTNFGLGDNIYLRPVLKWMPPTEIYLETPWPQVFLDLPKVKFLRPNNLILRTQKENVKRGFEWQQIGSYLPDFTVKYDLKKGNIIQNYIDALLGFNPSWLDNSIFIKQEWISKARLFVNTDRRICIIRPNTIRKEWQCPARNPHTKYLQRFINYYKDQFYIISIANLSKDHEEYDGVLEGVDLELTKGIDIEMFMGLFAIADMIVTSPSFWSALGIAMDKNMVIVYGAHYSHWNLNDPRCKTTKVTFVQPYPFDCCVRDKPNAFKDIPLSILDKAYREGVMRCYT